MLDRAASYSLIGDSGTVNTIMNSVSSTKFPLTVGSSSSGADAADEPIGTHQEAAAEGLPSGKGSSVTKQGVLAVLRCLGWLAGATALTVWGLLSSCQQV